MKNLATSKNDICLIAGSGLFVYEVANYLNNKNLLNQIVLINENNFIKKKFKDKCKSFKIKDIEKITTFIRSKNLKKVINCFSSEYKPYVIGKICKGDNRVKFNGRITWE